MAWISTPPALSPAAPEIDTLGATSTPEGGRQAMIC
jgi:hypothetical protein